MMEDAGGGILDVNVDLLGARARLRPAWTAGSPCADAGFLSAVWGSS